MKEIKFRVWNIEYRKMKYVDDRNLLLIRSKNRWALGVPFYDWNFENETNETTGILMQYTGVRDKNDNDIYEGDIVKFEDMLFKVVYVDGYNSDYYDLFPKCAFFGLVPLKQDKNEPLTQIMDFQYDDEYRYEVIGNVYENSYLLESENK